MPQERNITVLYGSQTGCAQEVAERIAREARRRHFHVVLSAMDDYERASLTQAGLAIFVCSVTGQGDEPDNMKRFWKFLLRKNLPADSLAGLKFAVFGLGDSSYQRFNFPAKKLYKRLIQLGAEAIHRRGDGDDQHKLGVDTELDPWLSELWAIVMALYPLPPNMEIISETVLPPPSFEIEFLSFEDADRIEPSASYALLPRATLIANERLTAADHFQDIRHLSFRIDGPAQLDSAVYNPGDVMGLYPKNDPDLVEEALAFFGWKDIADKPLQLKPVREDAKRPKHWGTIMTLRILLESHLDLFGHPRRYFFELLSFFSTDLDHAEKLREFASSEGQPDLYSYCHRMKRTTFEVLQDFHSAKVPLKYLLDLIPELRPRLFSIASSPNVDRSRIDLTVGIINYTTKLKKPRTGVCTSWLSSLPCGTSVPFYISRGTMKLPDDGVPAIFIGPGTGVAPMRSFIQERINRGHHDNVLFVGCRNQFKDYVYASEWQAACNRGQLKVFTAFSRDQDEKIYVQHRIQEQAKLMWELIGVKGGFVFLSGNAKRMPYDVEDALKEIFKIEGNMTDDEALAYLRGLEKQRRFQQECWS
ncbi:uncharacterized protein BJ171DRAFT_503040 [Polychytrium aggregatum]|uniref:uncharacterized protein n=1 Tax=Polychytrium aggregatum TaxID=110093 RepID=UPI0022FE228F|nr:uncharacterized protein BJ171DRAFT_503040 [Polychytrium aggregatum]KAI9205118.1 hypothetical protein BJ171DRAFT_503040 [Polychytrium aggregatum]